jgi:hypothetical protein
MQSTQLGHRARVVVAAAVVAAGTLVAGCGGGGGGGGDGAAGLIRTTINLQSITQQGECEITNVKVSPVEIAPNPPAMANTREFVTNVPLTKGADNVTCTGSNQTIPMAPGKWKFTANLPSDPVSCDRDIAPGGNLTVNFKDGEAGCT